MVKFGAKRWCLPPFFCIFKTLILLVCYKKTAYIIIFSNAEMIGMKKKLKRRQLTKDLMRVIYFPSLYLFATSSQLITLKKAFT